MIALPTQTASISQIIASLKNGSYDTSSIGELSEIKSGKPFDEPIPSPGATSVTFRHDSKTKGSRAIRFSHGLIPNQNYWNRLRRLSAIVEKHSESNNEPSIVGFDVVEDALEVDGYSMPVLIMPWVEGRSLTSYARALAEDSDEHGLQLLAENLEEFGKAIQTSNFDHGDVSGGNLMVGSDGRIHLIDPDTLRHDEVQDPPITELGHVSCSHPRRSSIAMEDDLFRFPLEVLLVDVIALSKQPELVRKYGNEDSILLSEEDLANPSDSALFHMLTNHEDDELNSRASRLRVATEATSVTEANSILGILSMPKPIPPAGLQKNFPDSPLKSFITKKSKSSRSAIGGRMPMRIPDAMKSEKGREDEKEGDE